MKLPQKFTVTAKGSHPASTPYTMAIQLTEHYCIIDGMKLSWNEARAAFETCRSYEARRKALFPESR